MRKPFEAKISQARDAVDDVRSSAQQIGEAAHSQATLNIALTAVAVVGLLLAAYAVHRSAVTARC